MGYDVVEKYSTVYYTTWYVLTIFRTPGDHFDKFFFLMSQPSELFHFYQIA